MILYRSLAEDLVEILVGSSLRGPCVIQRWSLTEDLVPVGSSLGGPCMQISQMPCIRGACPGALLGGCRRFCIKIL